MFESLERAVVRLLRWSEKYTKTDMVFLASGGVYSLVGQAASIIASLALAVAVSHLVSKESYGIYKYVVSVIAIFSLFSLNSIGSAVFQSAAQGFDGVLIRGFWENIRWSAAVFGGALLFAVYYFIAGNNTLAIEILIGGAFSPFLASASLFGSFLGGKKDYYRLTIYGIFDNVLPILAFIAVIFFTDNPIVLVATYFLTNTLAALFFYRRTMLVYRARLNSVDAGFLNYSKHLSFMGIISGIANNIDQILLFHFVGAAQLAVYNFATAVPDQIRGPSKMLDSMLQAQYTRRTSQEIRSSMLNKVLWSTFGYVVATAVYITIAPWVYRFFFPQYTDAIWLSQLYSLWMLTLILDPLYNYILSRRLVREQYIITGTYSAFQIFALFAGAVYAGVVGVIVARLLSRVVIMLVPAFLYRRAMNRNDGGPELSEVS